MIQVGLYSHRCGECGKGFECRREYAYKIHKYQSSDDFVWFCSYRCLRQYEKTHQKPEKQPTRREQEYLDQLDSGLTIEEIARREGVNPQRVRFVRDKWRDKHKLYEGRKSNDRSEQELPRILSGGKVLQIRSGRERA